MYFGDMVAYTDKIIGKIVDKLEALGLRDNTPIIFTGDNGTDKPIVSMIGQKIMVQKVRLMSGELMSPLLRAGQKLFQMD